MNSALTPTELKTLALKLEIGADRSGGAAACWPWTRSRTGWGYGRVFALSKRWDAHRAAYLVAHGSIPAGVFILHRCDNPACVNPAHLRAGTHTDNMRDMARKGRAPPGHGAKLSPTMAAAIRQDRRTTVAIGKEYGVNQCTISRIKTDKTYR